MNPLLGVLLGSSLLNTLGGLFGSKGGPGAKRQNALLNSFLQPGAFDEGGAGRNFFFGQPSSLQRTTRSGIEAFLNQPAPETRTLDVARPILEGMLTGTGPQFEHDIAAANSQGGRFGSANAILRGEALRNLFNLRNQTAGTLGALSSSAGDAPFRRLLAGGEFADQDMVRRMQLLAGLFGQGNQIAFGGAQQPNWLQTLGQGGTDIGTILTLFSAMGGEGAGGSVGHLGR